MFAPVKDSELFELAIELGSRNSSYPPMPVRAARHFAVERPEFALAAGMTALRGLANEGDYDITGIDVLDAYAAVIAAGNAIGVDEALTKVEVRKLIAASGIGGDFVCRVLAGQMD